MTDDDPPADATPDDPTDAAKTDPAVVEALADHATPLDAVDPGADPDELAGLDDLLGDARIVALGEATHGSREFYRLKHRILRHLVTEHGIRAVGLEANFPEALALDDYVVHGEGDPVAALEGVFFWVWTVESVLATVEWLRAFNADRPLADRVRFYGFDAQYSQGAVRRLREFFEDADPEFLATVREDLEAADDEGIPPHQDDEREARVAAADRVVPLLRERLEERRAAYVADTSERAWDLARQYVRVIDQASDYRRAMHDRQAGDGDEEAVRRCLRVRDRAMADNVDWIAERAGADRVALWGHDAHLNRAGNTSRTAGVTATSAGGHLADRHGEGYCVLGFAFGRGSFQAIGEVPDPDGEGTTYALREFTVEEPRSGTIEATLADLDYPIAVVNLRAASEDDRLAGWLGDPRRHLSVGSTFDPEDPEDYVTEYAYADAFDGICYVDETERARPIDGSE